MGFRLAKELNHSKVYSIDYRLDLPFEKLIDFAKKNDNKRFESMVTLIEEQKRIGLFRKKFNIRVPHLSQFE